MRPKFVFKGNKKNLRIENTFIQYLPKKVVESGDNEWIYMVYRAFLRIERRRVAKKISKLPARLRAQLV